MPSDLSQCFAAIPPGLTGWLRLEAPLELTLSQLPAQERLPRSSCPGSFWTSPSMETPQAPWKTYASSQSPSQSCFFMFMQNLLSFHCPMLPSALPSKNLQNPTLCQIQLFPDTLLSNSRNRWSQTSFRKWCTKENKLVMYPKPSIDRVRIQLALRLTSVFINWTNELHKVLLLF